jgi:hypothetical protein
MPDLSGEKNLSAPPSEILPLKARPRTRHGSLRPAFGVEENKSFSSAPAAAGAADHAAARNKNLS